jgi:flagellar motor switch protein FliN/FliY
MSEEISESDSPENNDGMAATMAAQGEEGGATEQSDTQAGGDSDYERAEFKDLNTGSSQLTTADANLDGILDIPVTISMEIGRTELPIQNLLQLNQGSVVELDRLAGEPMDVLINGTLIAHGEVVVINEKFGIRLTDVISPAERVKKLK